MNEHNYLKGLNHIELELTNEIIINTAHLLGNSKDKHLTYGNIMNILTSVTAKFANDLSKHIPFDDKLKFCITFAAEFNNQLSEKMNYIGNLKNE